MLCRDVLTALACAMSFTYSAWREAQGVFAEVLSKAHHPEQAAAVLLDGLTRRGILRCDLANRVSFSHHTFQEYFRRNPMMEKFAALLPHTVGVDNSPYLQEVFEAISQEYEACCIYGRKDPQQAIRDAAIRSETILRRK